MTAENLASLRQRLHAAIAQLNAVIVDKQSVIELAMSCLLARGHLLLEDLPGAGKTTLAKAFAATLGLSYRRVQFTSDLLPADIIGFAMLDKVTQKMHFHQGAIFTQLLLADEINRASPKSQSALLEAMAERQITIEQHSYPLPAPFFVIATQNPLEQIGTYPLPESQLDRFLMRLSVGYMSAKHEAELLRGKEREQLLRELNPVLSQEDILMLQTAVERVFVSQSVAEYAQKLLAFTRDSNAFVHGLSTRAGLSLMRAAKAFAFLQDADTLLPEHIQAVFVAVAWHRLRDVRGGGSEQSVAEILEHVPVPL